MITESVSSAKILLIPEPCHLTPDLDARKQGRPRRRYYELTPAGRRQLAAAEARFHAVRRLFPKRSAS